MIHCTWQTIATAIDVVTYWTMIRTHIVPDRHQYDGNTPITSDLVHIQLLYGILHTTTSRPNTNTSTITLHAELLFIWTACDIPNIAKEIQNNRQLDIIYIQPNIYIHTTNRQQNTQTQYPRHGEKPGINMTQATTTAVLETQQMYKILHHQLT